MAGAQHFGSDRSLTDSGQDRLGVVPFVRRLIRPLLPPSVNNRPGDSLVVGLYGLWDHGKSTALNFLAEALDETKESATTLERAHVPQALAARFTPTPRDMVRLLNAYRFAALAGDRRPLLHAADLLLLCALQVRFPDVYEAVRTHRPFLTGAELHVPVHSTRERASRPARRDRIRQFDDLIGVPETERRYEKDESAHDRKLHFLHEGRRLKAWQVAYMIVEYLFPYALDGPPDRIDQERDRYARRIRSPERFAAYFRLAPPPEEVPLAGVLAFYDVLIDAGRDATAPCDPEAITAVERFRGDLAELSAGEQRSFFGQLHDRAAAMTRLEARALATSLPAFTRLGSGVPPRVWSALAEHVVRVLTSIRPHDSIRVPGHPDDKPFRDDDSRAADLAVALVEALPAQDGAEYADELVRKGPNQHFHLDTLRRVANEGRGRASEVVFGSPDVFATLDGYAGAHAVWMYHRLEAAARGSDPDGSVSAALVEHLGALLTRAPDRLSNVLSLAAGWSNEPSFKRRPLREVQRALERVVDVPDVEARVRAAASDAVILAGQWPALIPAYRAMLRAAGESAA